MTGRILLSPPHMDGAEQKFITEVFESNWIAPTGPMVTAFEDALSRLTGFRSVAALASGTAALHLALRLAGVGEGDEVWCPTMTFIGGVAPILYVGARPVFLDIDPDQLLLDLDLLEEALHQRRRSGGPLPGAVLTTDLYGQVIDGEKMTKLRAEFGFRWISDSAEAIGSYDKGKHAGTGADLAVYSFNGNKIITTSGGGALASNDETLIERARFLSSQARDDAPHYQHSQLGYNYRLSSVCAAIGMGQLLVLEDRVAARRSLYRSYRSRLAGVEGLSFTPDRAGMVGNRWLTTVRIDPRIAGFSREDARAALERQGIESRPLWKPMHLQPLFAEAAVVGGKTAERCFDDGLCLPSGSQMSQQELIRVCEVIAALAKP